MRLLLIGEFSGVHNNLKKGLESLGHQVFLASDGDGFKGFAYNFQIAPYKGKIIGKLLNIIFFLLHTNKFIGYDVIQFINPFSIPYYYHFFGLTRILFAFNNKKVYYACGSDPAFINSNSKFKYFPFDDPNSSEYITYNFFELKYYKWFIENINFIAPANYSYALGYTDNRKLVNAIPLPGTGEYSHTLKSVSVKLNFLHGITRPNFKGSTYILEALKEIQNKYPEKVTVTVIEKLPFAEYSKIMDSADVVIDQCKSYDYGINAIIAMEKGKIVLSGSEKEAIDYFRLNNVPIINITPSKSQIYEQIESVILMNDKDRQLKMSASVDFAAEHHGPKKIAAIFIKLYGSKYLV